MKAKDLREKKTEELLKLLTDLKEKLFKLRTDLSLQRLKNTAEIRKTKKDIARVLTVLREKGIKL